MEERASSNTCAKPLGAGGGDEPVLDPSPSDDLTETSLNSSITDKLAKNSHWAAARLKYFVKRRQLKKDTPVSWDTICRSRKDLDPLENLAWVRQHREETAKKERDVKGRIHGLLLMLDLKVPLHELARHIIKLEELDEREDELIKLAKAKLLKATEAQERRREAERKAELERRYAAALEVFKRQLALDAVEVDCDSLREHLKLCEGMDLTAEDQQLIQRVTEKLLLAAKVQEEARNAKRRQAESALELQLTSIVSVELSTLNAAYEAACSVEASPALLSRAQDMMGAVHTRDAAVERLNALLKHSPVEVARDALHDSIVNGTQAGVPLVTIQRATTLLREAEAAQLPHEENARRLERFLVTKPPPLEVDMSELRRAHDLVVASGPVLVKMGAPGARKYDPEAMLKEAQQMLREADAAQTPYAQEVAKLVVLAQPLGTDIRPLGAAKAALRTSEKLGVVSAEILELVRTRIADAEETAKAADAKESFARVGTRRAAEYAKRKLEAAERRAGVAAKALEAVRKQRTAGNAALEALLPSHEGQLRAALRAEEEVAREERAWRELVLSGVGAGLSVDEQRDQLIAQGRQLPAEEARGACYAARDALVASQVALQEAVRLAAAVRQEEERVGNDAARARWEVEWAAQLRDVAQQELSKGLAPPSPPPSPSSSPRPIGQSKGGGGGLLCCGGKASSDVDEPTPQLPPRAIAQDPGDTLPESPAGKCPPTPGQSKSTRASRSSFVSRSSKSSGSSLSKKVPSSPSKKPPPPPPQQPSAPPVAPPLHIDVFSWLPLTLGVAHVPDVLLELAHCGAYASAVIAAPVASACCKLDCEMGGRFVRRLSESVFGEPMLPITGGGGPGIRSTRGEGRSWNKDVLTGKKVGGALTPEALAQVVAIWLAQMSVGKEQARILASTLEHLLQLYPEQLKLDYTLVLEALLQLHFREDPPGTSAMPEGVAGILRCLQLILSSSLHLPQHLKKRVDVLWMRTPTKSTSPAHTLSRTAEDFLQQLINREAGYAVRRQQGALEWEDQVIERVILALAGLFIKESSSLLAFQQLVPRVFDVYLAHGTRLRSDMCRVLDEGGMDKSVVTRIAQDDELARQRFFWSAAGVMLFGHPELLNNPVEVKKMLDEAVKQQPSIVVSFLEEACDKAAVDDASEATLGIIIEATLKSLLEHAAKTGLDTMRRPMVAATERILEASTRHYSKVYAGALRSWTSSPISPQVLSEFCTDFKPRLDGTASLTESSAGSKRHEYIIQALASLFIEDADHFDAFSKLVPEVFQTHLRLDTEARKRINTLLMAHSFEKTLEGLIANSDEFVSSPFFWNSKVMPLFTEVVTNRDYPRLLKTSLVASDGSTKLLYPKLLALLLRIASGGSGDPAEIARRTKEVLDQFERNEDQQKFLLTIFDTLEQRSRSHPEMFHNIQLTLLGDVAQNGVETISSVKGEGMQLCEQAMTTLLQTYIKERDPEEWKFLFKEATNISFMVKYMFRENLELAKKLFMDQAKNKDNFKYLPKASDIQAMMIDLVEQALAEYGDVGIYDPAKLAEIDFINQPQLLVNLVNESLGRGSRRGKSDMALMTQITATWMEHMVEKGFPPLSPHHTQAFTVLMAVKFFRLHLKDKGSVSGTRKSRAPPALKCFVAQLATGEGKSIVIAMLAIFMVKLYGVKVHVLENNAGLLERDYATNKPFYDKFGIKSSIKLDEPEVQICYCLKAAINTRFLRKMIEGTLDEELGNTVLIVDEVDDLIINEWPNAHYVRKDDELTPALVKSFAVLKKGGTDKPPDVAQDVWDEAAADVAFCNQHVREGQHYRIMTDGEKKKVFMLDRDGNLPKVPLTSPWLQYMNYKHCGIKPSAQSRHACVCTPYIFNKYKGIFGLTASVGGKAELDYLTKTYKAVKFDVPRFLDTCVGNARKQVINHGVEIADDEPALIRRVVQIAKSYFRKVPVLVIASSIAELSKLQQALQSDSEIPSEEVQRFSEFDDKGRSLKLQWTTLIDDATKRLGSSEDNRCRITVTDSFGGRGHDFQVVDKEANANGGLLVIATSIPDKREWIQWKGRTARQDRPGQFHVVLNAKARPFTDPKQKKLQSTLRNMASEDAKVELLLELADDGIGERLSQFSTEQARGEKLNELTEIYYKTYPRAFEDPWPLEKFNQTDVVLRRFLTHYVEKKPSEIRTLAKSELGIELHND